MGIYWAQFPRRGHDLGRPFSIYLLQGASLYRFSDRLRLNYEWNLGMSFDWRAYDAFDNPDNMVIGATTSVHIAGNVYLKWLITPHLDLDVGVAVTHFSNGDSSLPNAGINAMSGTFGLTYNFNVDRRVPRDYEDASLVDFKTRTVQDIGFLLSSRQVQLDTTGTGLSTPFYLRNFRVAGANYSFMWVENVRYAWGPSVEFTYDESSGVRGWAERNPFTGKMMDRVVLDKFGNRLLLSTSLKGEMMMPLYSIFAQLGYDVVRSKDYRDPRFYQIIGVRIVLGEHPFFTFGIRATGFSSAQYLYWSFGYRIKNNRPRKHEL